MNESRVAHAASALTANAIILGVLCYVGVLHETDFDHYYRSLQEDEVLEWATYWAFIGASLAFAVAAVRQRRAGVPLPWFLAGVSLFCFVVGMEEISWAQRVFSYRPPVYFLEKNFQQEFNIHNVMSTDLRKLALKLVIGVYGGLLPLMATVTVIRRFFDRLGVVAAPLGFVPAFAATYWLYEAYPWKYSGETVELMLGLAFLFSSLWALGRLAQPPPGARRVATDYAVAFACVMALGVANTSVARLRKSHDPLYGATAQIETDALRADFEKIARRPGGRLAGSCDVHKRVYSYKEKYDGDSLLEGRFAALQGQGLPQERAEFFLDPWNAPYWIRDRCPDSDAGTPRRTFVYSFGPNMKRDSSATELGGDDVGAYIHEAGPATR
ncbi:MAG: hypothetical protein V3R77_03140 [Candidatus Binatia bacterium]